MGVPSAQDANTLPQTRDGTDAEKYKVQLGTPCAQRIQNAPFCCQGMMFLRGLQCD